MRNAGRYDEGDNGIKSTPDGNCDMDHDDNSTALRATDTNESDSIWTSVWWIHFAAAIKCVFFETRMWIHRK